MENTIKEMKEFNPLDRVKFFTEEEIKSHISLQFPNFTGTRLVITKLFDKSYSLSYWGKVESGDRVILIRKIVKVENLGDTLRIVEDPKFGFNELAKLVK